MTSRARLDNQPLIFAGDLLPLRSFDLPTTICGGQLIANLECVLTDQAAAGDKAHSVILPTDAVRNLPRARFAAVSVANNHVLDAGRAAFDDMLRLLGEQLDAQVYGTVQRPFAELSYNGDRCAVVGCLEKCRSRGTVLFREEQVTGLMRELSRDFAQVYVTPHWGKEGEFAFYPSPRQVRLARQWIAAGAAGIFGHHPHVMHGRQTIDSRPVYYSLGNLWFAHAEGARYPGTRLGLAVTVSPGTAAVKEHFLHTSDAGVSDVSDNRPLTKWLASLSESLDSGRWSKADWARTVAPLYLSKSERSWRERVRSGSLKTRLMHLVWNVLPTTILMRLVRAAASTDPFKQHQEVERILSAAARTEVRQGEVCSP